MGLSKDEVTTNTIDFIHKKASDIANNEVIAYSKDNPGTDITEDIKKLVDERCLSELMFRVSNHKFKAEYESTEALLADMEKWFEKAEGDGLHTMCTNLINKEIEKKRKAADNRTFLERFRAREL